MMVITLFDTLAVNPPVTAFAMVLALVLLAVPLVMSVTDKPGTMVTPLTVMGPRVAGNGLV